MDTSFVLLSFFSRPLFNPLLTSLSPHPLVASPQTSDLFSGYATPSLPSLSLLFLSPPHESHPNPYSLLLSRSILSCRSHGISSIFHHPPWILHTLQPPSSNASSIGLPNSRDVMEVGDCFTIEPSVEQVSETAGMGEMWEDKWTVVTKVSEPAMRLEVG